MSNLPKRFYRISASRGDLGFWEKGGVTFRTLAGMRERIDKLKKAGAVVQVFATDCDWKLVDSDLY